MGTRSGDVDPGFNHLPDETKRATAQMTLTICLNKTKWIAGIVATKQWTVERLEEALDSK